MSSEQHTTANPWIILHDFYSYTQSEDRQVSLDNYIAECRKNRGMLINALFGSGVGYVTILIGMLSGLCELARAFAIPLAEIPFHNLANNPAWKLYIQTGPLAMAALGVFILAAFFIFSHSALEKYKARRGIPSAFPKYSCSPVNVGVAFLFAATLFALCVLNFSRTWFFCVIAIPICIARTSSLLPMAINVKRFHIRLPQATRLLISIIVPSIFGGFMSEYVIPPLSNLVSLPASTLTITLILQLLFLLYWFSMLGIHEYVVQWREHKKAGDNKAPHANQEDLRTPRAWFIRALPYNAVALSSLFISLMLAMAAPAPLFELIGMIPRL